METSRGLSLLSKFLCVGTRESKEMMMNNKKVKFQFEMPEINANRLEELASEAGVAKKDIINSALTILEWAIGEVQAGKIIASVDESNDRYKEVLMPLLQQFALSKTAGAGVSVRG